LRVMGYNAPNRYRTRTLETRLKESQSLMLEHRIFSSPPTCPGAFWTQMLFSLRLTPPPKMRGTGKGSATDMTSFEAVAAEVVRHAKNNTIIVEKSTVPCRTAQMIQEMVCSITLTRVY
jgi:hypothetical protein